MAMLVKATPPIAEVHEQLSGELLDALLVHEGHEKIVRTCQSLECTNECRGIQQWRNEIESSG